MWTWNVCYTYSDYPSLTPPPSAYKGAYSLLFQLHCVAASIATEFSQLTCDNSKPCFMRAVHVDIPIGNVNELRLTDHLKIICPNVGITKSRQNLISVSTEFYNSPHDVLMFLARLISGD